MYPSPDGHIRAIHYAVRSGIADLWGIDRLSERHASFTPHLGIAYVDADMSVAGVLGALVEVEVNPFVLLLDSIKLIELERRDRLFRWEAVEVFAATRIMT
ncbi:hypothetical protein GCM10010178_62040 [Lentzea flava]|uniref:Uncharacterized protein n=1 Tax=Lentzea flava TaxID=103732 RepID=A0ABQ2V066_9PSEU|nr:hypothetical protein GCM10010178_62040 [Lentzea flava]